MSECCGGCGPKYESALDQTLRVEKTVREFESGATRDTDHDKMDYEGFLSPLVLAEFARYMHKHRVQADGTLRDSDNWQKGIPLDAYMKSMWRHFMEVWTLHRRGVVNREAIVPAEYYEALCALLFNVQGYLDVLLKHEPAAPPFDGGYE